MSSRMNADRPVVTISEVTLPTERPDALLDFALGFPEAGSEHPFYAFPLQGWAVGRRSPAKAIDLLGGQRRLPRLSVSIERPDIADRWPRVSWAARCGFAAGLGVVHLPRRFRLELSLELDDGTRTSLGVIKGERQALPATSSARFQPLLLTTLGRSGSTWLTWLLGNHPQLMAYRSFHYEPRVAGYFTEMLRALTQPASYYQALRGDIDSGGWWLGRNPNQGLPRYSTDPEIDAWLGVDYVESLIAFAAERTDALHLRMAEATGKTDAAYFVEKFPPIHFAQEMLWEIFPGTKEIFLVRDFRDVACSILDFSDKRGLSWYWMDGPASPSELIGERLADEVEHLLDRWAVRSERAFLVRYEDLIANPESVLSELFDYVGVDGSTQTVSRLLATTLDSGLAREHMTSLTPGDSVGRWQKDLDPPLLAVCEEAFADALETFGYAKVLG
jgi:hypothetical protein